jgi:hypothetical protein
MSLSLSAEVVCTTAVQTSLIWCVTQHGGRRSRSIVLKQIVSGACLQKKQGYFHCFYELAHILLNEEGDNAPIKEFQTQ